MPEIERNPRNATRTRAVLERAVAAFQAANPGTEVDEPITLSRLEFWLMTQVIVAAGKLPADLDTADRLSVMHMARHLHDAMCNLVALRTEVDLASQEVPHGNT